jgi:aspartate aminotransferase/aminotransferase
MAAYFNDVTSITLPQVRDVVEKRDRIKCIMDKLQLKRLPGSATFYFLVGIDNFPGSSLEFSLAMLLDHQIAVVPGSAYGQSTSRFVRVGIGTESEERINDALLVLKDVISTNNYDATRVHKMLNREGFHLFEEIQR